MSDDQDALLRPVAIRQTIGSIHADKQRAKIDEWHSCTAQFADESLVPYIAKDVPGKEARPRLPIFHEIGRDVTRRG